MRLARTFFIASAERFFYLLCLLSMIDLTNLDRITGPVAK